ncbi:MAG: hypothetical protein ACI4C1_09770 [Lachnospiraceae bacterium]
MKKTMNHKKLVSIMAVLCLLICLTNFTVPVFASSVNVRYSTHIAYIGWTSQKCNGQLSGTTGESRAMEAIQISVDGMSGGVQYRTHVQNIGWMGWVNNGQTAGTTGRSLRMEAIQIKLTGAISQSYDIHYRVHVQNIGWMNWVSNGQTAGTTGQSLRIEAIEIKLVKKQTTSSSTVLNNNKVIEFINDSRWKVGTDFSNSVTGKLPNTENLGWGCNAYARDFVSYVYNKNIYDGTKYTNISEIRAGDVLYVTPQHWMVVLARNGNQLDIIHGNWTEGKVCRGTFTISGDKIGSSKTFSYGYHY